MFRALEEDEKNKVIADYKHKQELILDQVRRETHKALGFSANIWSQQTPTDLDLHLRYKHTFDYVLLMRSIGLMFEAGVLCPTSNKIKTSSPLSFPLGFLS